MSKGKLILIPSPIDNESPLESVALKTLMDAGDKSIFCVGVGIECSLGYLDALWAE